MQSPKISSADRPRITVVTVVYNGAATLRETIESVLMQTYNNVEYIIIDGGSNDGTLNVIKEYAPRIAKWISEKDGGIYNAMNKGVALASGSYVNFMNCGDRFAAPDVLEKVAQEASEQTSDILYGDVLIAGREGAPWLKAAKKDIKVMHHIPFCHQSTFAKTSLLKRFSFDEKYKMSADFKFFKQCFLEKCSFAKVDFPIAIFGTSGISNTQRTSGLRENNAVVRELDSFPEKWIYLGRTNFVLLWMAVRKFFKKYRNEVNAE